LIGLSIATRISFKVLSILPKRLYENANFPISIKAAWSFTIKCPLMEFGLFTFVTSHEWKFDSKKPGCFDGYGKIGILIKLLRQNGRNFEGHAPGNGKTNQVQNSRLESF
jgi:hypothetical protein